MTGGGSSGLGRAGNGMARHGRTGALSVGKDAPEAGFVLLILLPDSCLQGPQLSAYHRRQGRVELQHLGKVSLGLLGIPHSSMGLAPLEVSLDIVCRDTRKQKACRRPERRLASLSSGSWAHHGGRAELLSEQRTSAILSHCTAHTSWTQPFHAGMDALVRLLWGALKGEMSKLRARAKRP